jgi:hypothetical protein
MKRFAGAAVILCLTVGVVAAEEVLTVYITKVEGNKITFQKTKAPTEPMTLEVSRDVKIGMGRLNKDTKKVEIDTPLEEGLSNGVFASGKTPARVTINNNKDRVLSIAVFKSKKKA